MLNVTMVGAGAIGAGVIAALRDDPEVRVTQLVVPAEEVARVRERFPACAVASAVDALPQRAQLLIECAGHRAVVDHVLPALRQGVDCTIVSIGALAEPGLPERLEETARAHGAHVTLVAGAIGGIDAIAAARIGGLDNVVYTGRKPPSGWKDTPAEKKVDLAALAAAAVIFEGSAREAARLYPKNANVAATVSLAGLGLDRTKVRLIADPAVARNIHHVRVAGTFGEMEITLSGHPLPDNPKTSALTVYSAVRALRNRVAALAI